MTKTQLSEGAINWLANGARGISSNTMFTVLTGVKALSDSYRSHPHDPDDFDRCLQLLTAAPELRPLLPKMAKASKHWAALVERWEEIEASHLEEVGLGWCKGRRAPKTYALMKSVLNGTNQAAKGEQV